MKILYNQSIVPAFNLALEEYMLTMTDLEIIMLWRNDRAVIIGRNQNAIEEINVDFVRENDISVIRRQSGGGAVFHDLGNINFTIIRRRGEDDFSDYEGFTSPVIGFLQSMGVQAELCGRNDLLIDGKKFSGNAQAVKHGRIMHHGTILYNADFTGLGEALRPNEAKMQGKGVKSARSRVTNVADHLKSPMPVEEFLSRLYTYFRDNTSGIEEYALTPDDIKAVDKLVEEKYSLWEWNFGRSPAYDYQKSIRLPSGTVEAQIVGKGAVMEEVYIYGDFFGTRDKSELEKKLCGLRHDKAGIAAAITSAELGEYIHGITMEEFLELF